MKRRPADHRRRGAIALEPPTRGLVGPDLFIPTAEKTGLILSIGDWVINEACRQMREWIDAGQSHWTIAVNISALQFAHASLVETVRGALARHNVPPSCLTLEVTESTAMRDAEASLAVLAPVRPGRDHFHRRLRHRLFEPAVPEAPAGHRAEDRPRLREPAGERQRGCGHRVRHRRLAQQLNLRIVAEGVETTAQQKFLTGLGCDSLQGFLLGKPMPATEFLEHANG